MKTMILSLAFLLAVVTSFAQTQPTEASNANAALTFVQWTPYVNIGYVMRVDNKTDDYMTVLIVTPTGSTTEGMVSPHSYNYFNAHDGFAPYYEGATIMLHFEAGNKQGNLRVRTKGTPYQQ